MLLKCPECETSFKSDINTHEHYTIECPECDMWEEGESNRVQHFILISN